MTQSVVETLQCLTCTQVLGVWQSESTQAGIIGASLVGVAPLHCETCSQRQQALGLTYLPAASSIT